jgi:hypothetical protein
MTSVLSVQKCAEAIVFLRESLVRVQAKIVVMRACDAPRVLLFFSDPVRFPRVEVTSVVDDTSRRVLPQLLGPHVKKLADAPLSETAASVMAQMQGLPVVGLTQPFVPLAEICDGLSRSEVRRAVMECDCRGLVKYSSNPEGCFRTMDDFVAAMGGTFTYTPQLPSTYLVSSLARKP